MFEARRGKEVIVETRDWPGLLFEISRVLAENGVNVQSVVGAVFGDDCVIHLVTDDNRRALDALSEKGYSPKEEGAILVEVPNKSGMLSRLAEVLTGEHLDILLIHAAALDDQEKCLIVLNTDNDEHALQKLNEIEGT